MVGKRANKRLERAEKRVGKYLKHPYLPNTWWHQKLKLSHHEHTGKLLPRRHTSSGILLLIFILTGWYITILTTNTLASSSLSGSVTVSGIVNGPAPTVPPIISRPFNDEKFSEPLVYVRGICVDGLFVEIYRNGIFAGSSMCSSESFDIQITLLTGLNKITAKHLDSLGQQSPVSDEVQVSYQVESIQSTSNDTVGSGSVVSVLPFTMITDSIYIGSHVRENLGLRLRWSGGYPPYAVVVDWGDGKTDIFSLTSAGDTEIKHAYQTGGTFGIRVSASDSKGSKAFIQTAAVISVDDAGTVKGRIKQNDGLASAYLPETFYSVWRVYVFGVVTVSVFWLGERAMYYRLSKHVDK